MLSDGVISSSPAQRLQNELFSKPMMCRCRLSTECPVYSPITVRSEFRSRFNMSLALLLLYPCIICLVWRQVLILCQYSLASLSAQLLIADFTLLNETGNVSSGLGIGNELATRANWSALSFPGMPECPGTQARMTDLTEAKSFKACTQSKTCFDSTLGLFKALSAAWLSEQIYICSSAPVISGMWYFTVLQRSQPERLLLLCLMVYFYRQWGRWNRFPHLSQRNFVIHQWRLSLRSSVSEACGHLSRCLPGKFTLYCLSNKKRTFIRSPSMLVTGATLCIHSNAWVCDFGSCVCFQLELDFMR